EGLSVALLEKTALPAQLEPSFDGRVSAIALGSKRILERIGVWEGMAAEAQPIADIRVSDGDTPFFLHYDYREVGDEPFGYIVENRHIRHALIEAARRQPSLALLEECRLRDVALARDYAEVSLEDGTLHGSLLIGADGKQSLTRRKAGIG